LRENRPRILLDITRLLVRGPRAYATGVDRVVLAYARWLMSQPDFEVTPVFTWRGRLVWPSARRAARILENAMPQSNGAKDGESEDASWRAVQGRLGRPPQGPPIRASFSKRRKILSLLPHFYLAMSVLRGRRRVPPAGAYYVNVGHSGLEYSGLLAGVAAHGVRPVVMIHDLIPLDFPEYCTPRASQRHERRLRETLAHAHAIVANSRATETDIRRYAEENQLRTPPILPLYLGLEQAFQNTTSAEIAPQAPYFICVGTIEPRKNIDFLLALWRQLVERLGPATPRLMVVGRRGWEMEAIIDHLERSPVAAQYVDEVADLHDGRLAELMRGARALLAPSFTEGFNLPVAEALAMGVPVIASDIPVHRELAREAVLLSPLDGPGWMAAIEAAMAGPRPHAPRPGPTWAEHFSHVGTLLRTPTA
jgi:glycosyltransferase involved in cell wall biosynthesis